MAATRHTSRYRDTVLSRGKIEALIAEGRKVVIVDGAVLKVDAWLPYHPGGDKAILHMVGRDATNEVKAFHSQETQALMQKYCIGKLEGQWSDFVPPIQGGTFRTDEQQQQQQQGSSATSTEEQSAEDSSASSQEPSPVFDPAQHRSSTLRRRRGSSAAASESSATSLDTLAIGEPAVQEKAAYPADERTQQEIDHDLEIYPSLDQETQTSIIRKYKELDDRLRAEGLYNCNYTGYAREIARYTLLGSLAYYFLQKECYMLSAAFLGMLWHQLVFTVHDAGHMGITHNFHVDSVIGMFVSNFLGGLSCCWWKRNHNVHHIVTNSAEHDPDIQHMPFFAISHKFFANLKSTYYDRIMAYDAAAQFVLKYQHYLYYPILSFGRFNLYVLSWQYIFLGQGPRKGPAWWHRYFEMLGQAFFWFWFGHLTVYKSIDTNTHRFLFVLISHAITMPVHVQITLSHFAMSTADLGVAESFPQRMLRTTMDVDCPEWLDFFHGGLQFQAVHHLFPRMPRHNLRQAQKLVMQYCDEVKIPYTIYDFTQGNGKVIGRLGEIAQQARIMSECQKAAFKDVVEGH
ncbi:putative cytochrome b5-like heme/steroid binding domain, fatty acid desaturase [Septoria linicola]|nr:putative cytochrome b5-like heme/steroid binding domain, fatty acid desaturase [Septoria linicola]